MFLSISGSRIRRFPAPTKNPFTWLFFFVSCPNYTYEVIDIMVIHHGNKYHPCLCIYLSTCIFDTYCRLELGWASPSWPSVCQVYSTSSLVDIHKSTKMCIFFSCLYVLYSSGIVRITGFHPDDHLGQREAQSLQQGVQGLSQPPDGHYPPDSLSRDQNMNYCSI